MEVAHQCDTPDVTINVRYTASTAISCVSLLLHHMAVILPTRLRLPFYSAL